MGFPEPGLITDLYELTMAQTYFQHGMDSPATFSLFIRGYPPGRAFFVAAGLEDVLRYLEEWSFPRESTDYLRSTGMFNDEFLDYLSRVRFTGDVWAIPEGRVFFAGEPILEVTGPVVEAQAVETYIINQVNLQAMIATKAARCVWAARGRSLVDFSLRRAHGVDSGMKVARASYLAGFDATSNVLAGKTYGIPISGTMAHSFVSSFPREVDSFRGYAESFPDRCVLLIDTYDTIAGARNAAGVGKEMRARGQRLQGVRLDSGDLASLSREVRRILDEAGLPGVKIVASGGLDEYDVEELVLGGATIDAFGVGTKMGVSGDAPWTDMAYKLVKYDGRPVLKLSTGKVSLPDEKQVFRLRDGRGMYLKDVIALREEGPEALAVDGQFCDAGEPLLRRVMEGGRVTGPPPTLQDIRRRLRHDLDRLDDSFKALRDPPRYPVSLSQRLDELRIRIEHDLRQDTSPWLAPVRTGASSPEREAL